MLDDEIEITGWHAAWLNRSLPAFQDYANYTSLALSLSICLVAIRSMIGTRRCARRFDADPSDCVAIYKDINRRIVKTCRAHWYIANVYLLNMLFIAVVDAYIGVVSLKDDASQNGEKYDAIFWVEVAAYCLYITVLFVGTMIVVPLMQVLGATWVLASLMRKHGVSTLAEYIPEARMYSTHVAQSWAIMSFFVMAWWAPTTDHSLLRWLVLQGAIGSSMAGLDASFAFNFCHKRLADQDFELGTGGVAEIARMFANTVTTVHFSEKKALLPLHVQATTITTANDHADEEKGLLANAETDEQRE